MKILLLLFGLVFFTLLADEPTIDEAQIAIEQQELQTKQKLASLKEALLEAEQKIAKKDSVWVKSYESYLASVDIRGSLENIQTQIEKLKSLKKRGVEQEDELIFLMAKEDMLSTQVEKLKKRDSIPFSNILIPPNIEDVPHITNPIDIFSGLSFLKNIEQEFGEYKLKASELKELITSLKTELDLYTQIRELEPKDEIDSEYVSKIKRLDKFESALETMNVTIDVYEKQLDIVKVSINKEIRAQFIKSIKIGVLLVFIFVLSFMLKYISKKYITDNERFYTANKIITFITVTLVVLILFFSYIENVSYLVTILGFASAGIAIAMKDWFMSLLGWLVIVLGGSFHVGDRIRVVLDGSSYVGDILDISLLRITILEDVTLTTVDETRRAGRMVFVPNNFVFTKLISNYTHSSLKTVWDGVDIVITFESNHKKAIHIAREVTKKYSKGYMDITRKQLNKLRNKYSLKHTNVEPRIFSFIESNGIRISSWYLTNAYATLTLRSTISIEIVDAFLAEDDITIAYPTQMMHLERGKKPNPPFENGVI